MPIHVTLDVDGHINGDQLPNISGDKKGGTSPTGIPAGNFLRDDGTWISIPLSTTHPHGEMYASNVSKTVVINTINVPVQINSSFTGGFVDQFIFQNARELKCLYAGVYLLNWSLSVHTSGVSNKEAEGSIMINGVAQNKATAHATVSPGGSNRPVVITASGFFNLAVDDLVSLALANHTDTTDFIMEHASLTIIRLAV